MTAFVNTITYDEGETWLLCIKDHDGDAVTLQPAGSGTPDGYHAIIECAAADSGGYASVVLTLEGIRALRDALTAIAEPPTLMPKRLLDPPRVEGEGDRT